MIGSIVAAVSISTSTASLFIVTAAVAVLLFAIALIVARAWIARRLQISEHSPQTEAAPRPGYPGIVRFARTFLLVVGIFGILFSALILIVGFAATA